jgi:hypothetical protein
VFFFSFLPTLNSLFLEFPKTPQLRQCHLCLLSKISTKRRCHSMEGLSHVDRGE